MVSIKSFAQKKADTFIYKAIFITMLLAATAYFIGYFFNIMITIVFSIGIIYGIAVWNLLTKKILPLSWNYKREIQGIEGERFVDEHLKETFEPDHLVLHDVSFKGQRGNIDHIVIGKNGIFVIETKTHRGRIKCYDDSWFQIIKNGNSRAFKNSPSKQVLNNVFQLKEFFNEHYPKLSNVYIHALIIFPFTYSMIDAQRPPKYCEIFNDINSLIAYIQMSNSDIDLSHEELDEIKKILT